MEPKHAALLRKLDWRVRHAADSVLSGEYRSTFRGKGMEFDQVVPYEFGDDVRDIDWNVTARLGEPYRKKFIEEREVTLMLLFEDSPSLQFGTAERTKRQALLEWAGLLALLATVNRDRLAILYAGPQGYWFERAARGRGAILHNASRLIGQEPVGGSRQRPEIPWKFVAHAVPRHSILIWLGDFPPDDPPAAWPAIRRRYQTMGMRIDDPWERELPEEIGALGAYDPISGEMVALDTAHSRDRESHREWAEARDRTFRALFPDPYGRLALKTNEDLLNGMVGFFRKRMARKVRT
jgi:uncharacterized protein (DUF58 family)